MTLFQFLRYILDITPVALFDIEGKLLCKAKSKKDLDTNLFDYKIFKISAAQADDLFDNKCYICIMLQK